MSIGIVSLVCQFLVQVLGELVQELEGVEVVGPGDVGDAALDAEGQVLGHESGLDGLDADVLEGLRELGQVGVAVELGPVGQTAGPGKYGGDGVGASLLALLMKPIKQIIIIYSYFSCN